MPNWTAGDVLLAMVLCRAGKHGEAEALVRKLPETIKKDPVAASVPYLFYAYYTLGRRARTNMPPPEDLAAKVYENALSYALFLPPISIRTRPDADCVAWSTCIGAIGASRMRDAPCSTWFVIFNSRMATPRKSPTRSKCNGSTPLPES